MSDLSNDTKKHTTKSRETIPLIIQPYQHNFEYSIFLNVFFKRLTEMEKGLMALGLDIHKATLY
jgi:hypothetical protein